MVTYFLTFLKHGFPAFSLFLTPAPEWLNYLIYKEKTEQIQLGFGCSWCLGRDSNSHAYQAGDFESPVSTISPPRHFLCGAGKRSRTSDLRITNALLYQLSYTGTQEMRLYRKRLFCAIRCRREVYSENSRKLTSEVVAHMKPSWKERLGLENASRLRTLHQYSKNVLGYLTWPAAREAAPGVNSFTIQNSG